MIPVLAARMALTGYDPRLDFLDGDILYPDPHPEWVEFGEQPCPFCARRRRLLEYSLQTTRVRACHGCAVSNGLSLASAISIHRVFDAVSDGWMPLDARSRDMLESSTKELVLDAFLLAVRFRFYSTTAEVRGVTGMPRAGAVRRFGVLADWCLDPSLPPEFQPVPWLVPIFTRTLGSES